MSRTALKPGNMLYPLPAVLVSCKGNRPEANLITVAWTGTVCSDPAMVYISVRPERFSHHLLLESGEFVINLVTEDLTRAMDYCGVRSGKDVDKWKECSLHPVPSQTVKAPSVAESPVCIECRVEQHLPLGSHEMFLARVTAVTVDERFLDPKGKFHLDKTGLIAYSHGEYRSLGKCLGTFGFSVRKTGSGKKRSEPSRRQQEPGSKKSGQHAW